MENEGEVQGKVYDQRHVDGMTKDLQKERTERQDAQFKLDQITRENESLRKSIEDSKVNKVEELISDKIKLEGEDEDFAKVKDVKLGFKSLEKEANAKFLTAQKAAKEAAEQEIAKEKFDNSCLEATTKYAKLADIGLDFRTVYQAAIRLIGRNKYEELAIFHSANPGERLYKKGCEDPEIKAKLDLEANQELLNNMDKRKVDKTSLTGGTKVKNDEFFTPQEVSNLTPAEAMENLPKIEKSMVYWEECRKGTK